MELKAVGDTGEMGIISAKLKTYDDVTQQRTVAWFRDTGVAVVNDQMESGSEQPYEWYLNPIGKLIIQGKVLTFSQSGWLRFGHRRKCRSWTTRISTKSCATDGASTVL
jgi:hypothetical protein